MPRWGILAVLVLVLASGVVAEPDPWAVPEPTGVLLVAALTESPRSYAIVLFDGQPEDIGSPDRVELPLKSHELRALDKCRKAIEEGEFARAEKLLGVQCRKNRQNYDALALRALCQVEMGKPDRALENLEKSLIGNRRNPEAWKVAEKLAAETGRKLVRPTLTPRGWIRPPKDGEVEFGYDSSEDEYFPWLYYAASRAFYRHEGPYRHDFPDERDDYRYTFRELLYAVGATVGGAEETDDPVGEGLARLVAERKAGTLVPFSFFALYTEPIPKSPERDFDELRPVLEKYLHEHILVPVDPEDGEDDE